MAIGGPGLWLRLAVAAVACALACQQVRGGIVFSAVVPHGDFALDPSLVHNANGSLQIHNAAVDVGKELQALQPDVILLTTPHGLADSNNFIFFENSNASGFALIGQDLHNGTAHEYKVPLSVRLAPNLTKDLVSTLRASPAGQNVSGLLAWADSEAMPIRWGEVVPLWFLRQFLGSTAVVIMSVPTRRYTQDVAMVPELLRLGEHTGRFLEGRAERVAVVISCDLAHTHLASGPYGFSKAAEPFDEACGSWAATLQPSHLLATAASLVDAALSCGFTGLVMLQGIFTAAGPQEPALLANYHPTYYGMLVARFLPKPAE